LGAVVPFVRHAFPHFPPVVEVLHNLRRVLDVALHRLLVQRQSVDWPNALLKVAVDNRAEVTLPQLTQHKKNSAFHPSVVGK